MLKKIVVAATMASVMTLGTSTAYAQAGADFIPGPVDLEIGHDHNMMLFEWNHIGFSTTYAVIRHFTGTVHVDPINVENSKVDVVIDMTSFDSFFEPRDTILKSARFLNVEAFPEATFVSTEVVKTGDYTADVTGDFTFMGKTSPVTLAVNFNGAGGNMGAVVYGFSATTTLDRGNLGLTDIYPRVAPEITVRIHSELEVPEGQEPVVGLPPAPAPAAAPAPKAP